MRARHLVSAAALVLGLGAACAAVGCAALVGADFGERELSGGGESEPCYEGPPGTELTMPCQAGRLEDGECVGQVLPMLEMCGTDLIDENCDGFASCDGAAIAARSFGDGDQQQEIRVAVDADGNVIFAVAARGQVEYGGGPRGGTGDRDVHVVKLGPTLDTHEWSVVFDGGTDHYVTALALDPEGSILVGGYYKGSIDVGGVELAGGGTDAWDIFVAKLDPSDGSTIWAKGWAGAAEDVLQSIAVDLDGSILVAGWTTGTLDVGGQVVTSAGLADAFVAKLDAEGGTTWATSWGDAFNQRALGVAVGHRGDVAVVGDFEGTVDFGSGPVANTAGAADGFIAVIDKDKNPRWGRGLHSAAPVRVIDAAIARMDYLLITGSIEAADVDFGAPAGVAPHAGSSDAYLAAYQLSDGLPLWVQSYGDGGSQVGVRLAVDAAGNVLWTGSLLGSVTFDGQQQLSSNITDAFAVKLAPPGETTSGDTDAGIPGPAQVIWGQLLGGDFEQYGVDITAGPLGNVVVGGYTSTDFKIGTIAIEHAGAYDVWVASLRP